MRYSCATVCPCPESCSCSFEACKLVLQAAYLIAQVKVESFVALLKSDGSAALSVSLALVPVAVFKKLKKFLVDHPCSASTPDTASHACLYDSCLDGLFRMAAKCALGGDALDFANVDFGAGGGIRELILHINAKERVTVVCVRVCLY